MISSSNEERVDYPVPNPSYYDGERITETVNPAMSQTMRSIRIDAMSYGFIVNVGCQSFAIETKETLIAKLTEYINDPSSTELKWNAKELF